MPQVDYDALARQQGGTATVDYNALAASMGGAKQAPRPAPTPGMLARQQSREHPGRYLREMVENVPGDVVRAGKGVIGLLEMAGNAQKELHQNVIGVGREFFGFDPQYTDTPNMRAVGALPGQMLEHYAGYLDPDERALRVRDRPISTLLDIAGAKGTVQGGTAALRPVASAAKNVAAKATTAAMKAPARVVDTAIGVVRGYATGNPMPAVRGVMGQGPVSQGSAILDAIMPQTGARPVPSHTPTPPVVEAATPPSRITRHPDDKGAVADWLDRVIREATEEAQARPRPATPTQTTPAAPATAQDALRQELVGRDTPVSMPSQTPRQRTPQMEAEPQRAATITDTLKSYPRTSAQASPVTVADAAAFDEVLFHGSPKTDLQTISAGPVARQFDNATSQLGAFFSRDTSDAARYAGKTGTIHQARVTLQRPYEMSWGEFAKFQDPLKSSTGSSLPFTSESMAARQAELVKEAAALRQTLVAAGHDGIIVRSPKGKVVEVATFQDVPVTAKTAQDALRQEVMSRAEQIKANEALAAERLGPGFDYRTTDAVKLDAITRDISRPGGSILEAGESRIGLGERLAEALGRAEKAKTPAAAEAALTEARRLAKAARQRMHIAEKQAR